MELHLAGSRELLRRACGVSAAVLVALSGGKDSLATLAVCRDAFPRVEAFYMYLVPGLSFVEEPMDRLCNKLGVKLHKVPHWSLAEMLRKGLFADRVRALHLRNLKQRDVEDHLRQVAGIEWTAWGHRQSDSVSRRFYLRKIEGYDPAHHRLHPIWNWSTDDVLRYLKAKGITPPEHKWGQEGRGMTGFNPLRADCLLWIRNRHPSDWQRVLKVFPQAEAVVYREASRTATEESARGTAEDGSGPNALAG